MSKFDKIFEAREHGLKEASQLKTEKKPKTVVDQKAKETLVATSGPTKSTASKTVMPERAEENFPQLQTSLQNTAEKKRGRPHGKRTDPNFIGFTTYIRKQTHLDVKIALLKEGKGRELSQLVEELLGDWLADKTQ